jgi:mRNA interferase YafQ
MRTPIPTTKFKKEISLMGKRGKAISKLDTVIAYLVMDVPLPATYLNHPLHGKWAGKSECHIEPDWLLIYEVDDDAPEHTVTFHRTGTHADLF